MITRNVILTDVLFSLYATDKLKWPALARTHFQRLLYLCAALSALSNTEWGYEFSNSLYGPFNGQVSSAADELVHRGYAEALDVRVLRNSKMKANFRITESGRRNVEFISNLKQERQRLGWIETVSGILNIYGPAVMSKLAYFEPTFIRMKQENRIGPIDLSIEENQSIQLLHRLSDELKKTYSIHLDTPTSNLIFYFDYMSRDIGKGRE